MTSIVFKPSSTLDEATWGPAVKRILAAGLHAVEPGEAVRRFLRREGERLWVGEKSYDLPPQGRVFLVGAGKAGAPMTQAAVEIIANRLHAGIVIVKEGHLSEWKPAHRYDLPSKLDFIEAGHPIPDERGMFGGARIRQLLAGLTSDDLVIALLSGGGSALMVSPVDGVSLAKLQALTNALLACGASIDEINTLRKHLEQLKGGRLAQLCYPARTAALILSDVVGDSLDVIASGPTMPDPSTFDRALWILERYDLFGRVSADIVTYLQGGRDGHVPETPKPGDAVFGLVQNLIIGSNRQAAQAALDQAKLEGFNTLLLTTFLQGEARQAGRFLASVLRQAHYSGQPLARPGCIIAGGETTVTLTGGGQGGRNQELALGAVADLAGLTDVALATLATDGGDGPTDAAGALVSGHTLLRARKAGLSPEDHLKHNDAYHFFDSLGDLLRTGPTRTNVNDLAFLFAF